VPFVCRPRPAGRTAGRMADQLVETETELEGAAVRLREAEAYSTDGESFEYVWSRAQEAFAAAKKALVLFRRQQKAEGRNKALGIVVKAELLMGDTFDALQFAQDELETVKRVSPDDKASKAAIIELVVSCLEARGDGAGALANTENLLALRREMKDREGEGKALRLRAQMTLQMGEPKKAIEAAEESVKIFRELKLGEEEDKTTRILSQAFCQKGQPELAPGRDVAKRALEALTAALSEMDAQAWGRSLNTLTKTGAYSQADFDDAINKALKSSQDSKKAMMNFLEVHGIDTTRFGGRLKSFAAEVNVDTQYKAVFFGMGMMYGPHFKTLQQTHLVGLENEAPQYAASVIQCPDGSDFEEGWEKELQWNPGVLDGMLHGVHSMR